MLAVIAQHATMCGKEAFLSGLQLKSWEFLQTTGQPIYLFYVDPDWSIAKFSQSRLINSISSAGKMIFSCVD